MYRILVVEDDAVISEQIAKYLEKWGYDLKLVRDFADVMGEFAACEPQLVLLDIGLPFITATTGAARSARCPRCRSSLSPRHQII